jgi:hypothetical protein
MVHFNIWQWVDFSRGLAEGIDRGAMETHLASGCDTCRRMVHVLAAVGVAARADAEYEPPASALRLARAIFPPAPSKSLVARLVFDTFREPLPAGLRSQEPLTRHALWEAGSYYVDLRVEHQRPGDMVTLVGQLADRDNPGANAADVRVQLKTRDKTLATAACNRFGEFHLDYRPAPALRLDVCLGTSGKRLELPLSGLTADPAARRREARDKRKAGNRTREPD